MHVYACACIHVCVCVRWWDRVHHVGSTGEGQGGGVGGGGGGWR